MILHELPRESWGFYLETELELSLKLGVDWYIINNIEICLQYFMGELEVNNSFEVL